MLLMQRGIKVSKVELILVFFVLSIVFYYLYMILVIVHFKLIVNTILFQSIYFFYSFIAKTPINLVKLLVG